MYEDDDYYDDVERGDDSCPCCGRAYDEIDYEYQICSRCNWDNSKS